LQASDALCTACRNLHYAHAGGGTPNDLQGFKQGGSNGAPDQEEVMPSHLKSSDYGETDYVADQYGLTQAEARQLIRTYGYDRKELEAAAGRLKVWRKHIEHPARYTNHQS
jgi:hypothetical protein